MEQDKAAKDVKLLKQRIELLEKENAALKKSLYDLSARFNMLAPTRTALPLMLDSVDVAEPGIDSLLIDSTKMPVSNGDEFMNLGDVKRGREGRHFYLKYELKGHTGAVYSVQFSPCGKYLASGSFDKSVRIWDAVSTSKELHNMKRHNLNISDLCWSNNSTELLSGGYDQNCVIWDVEAGKHVEAYETEGFVQCVMMNPSDNKLFFYGTSRNVLGMVDRRKSQDVTTVFRNEAMVNAIHVFRDGTSVVTGDSAGYLKTWDVRTGKCLQSLLNESTRKPISHIAACPTHSSDDESRYFGVNGYDNVLRVYDRGLSPPQTQQRLIQSFRGYKNKNWPIKSSFYRPREAALVMKRNSSNDDVSSDVMADMVSDSLEKDSSSVAASNSNANLLLATGSADPYVYVYSMGLQENTGELLQRIEGHSDRVYCASFHPSDPILASCSADFSVKVWYSNIRKKK
ncbi:quinon protein alcohol dehydrogenase-like superfamily [Chytridium lagenaria]|nr:quinon protein alcohol dehydrogenase-like superfamily [Chytridium lagenaria]